MNDLSRTRGHLAKWELALREMGSSHLAATLEFMAAPNHSLQSWKSRTVTEAGQDRVGPLPLPDAGGPWGRAGEYPALAQASI